MSPRFVHLHLHTEFSLVDSVVRINGLMEAVVAARMPAVAMTDQGNLFAMVKFYRAALRAGLKPVIGADVWLLSAGDEGNPTRLILLCRDIGGYQNLSRLLTRAYMDGLESGVPVIAAEWLDPLAVAGLMALSGGREGAVGRHLLAGRVLEAQQAAEHLRELFGGDFFIELQRTGRPREEEYIQRAVRLAETTACPVVATNDVRFLSREDFEVHEARVCIQQGFLVCIDRFYREAALRPDASTSAADLELVGPEVVYVSPLKALAADIQQNLEIPLAEIREVARELGLPAPDLRVALRSGDTTASRRAAMLKRPPDLLITTPESLYLMVTAERSRAILRRVRTVIVDEIHAVARDKRGCHLGLTLERLDALCETRPARIGLSATQRPIEKIARLLVGAGPERSEPDGSPRCAVVDEGHQRQLDLALGLPNDELEAVSSHEQLGDILDQIAKLVDSHKTTLVFVNTRRMAERLAHLLAERLPEQSVAAHHGSLSKDRRLRVEARLRGSVRQGRRCGLCARPALHYCAVSCSASSAGVVTGFSHL